MWRVCFSLSYVVGLCLLLVGGLEGVYFVGNLWGRERKRGEGGCVGGRECLRLSQFVGNCEDSKLCVST